jgi:hypothetical protein
MGSILTRPFILNLWSIYGVSRRPSRATTMRLVKVPPRLQQVVSIPTCVFLATSEPDTVDE